MENIIISTDCIDKQERIEQIMGISPLPVAAKLGGSHTLHEKWYAVTRKQNEVISSMRPDDDYDLVHHLFGGPVWGNITISYSRRGVRETEEYYPTESHSFPEGTSAFTKVKVRGVNDTLISLWKSDRGWSSIDNVISCVEKHFGKKRGAYGCYAYDPVSKDFLPRLPFNTETRHKRGLNAIYEKGELIGFDYQLGDTEESRTTITQWQEKLHPYPPH